MSDYVTRLIQRAAGMDDSPRVIPMPNVYSPEDARPAFSEWEIEDESQTGSASPVAELSVTQRPPRPDGRRPASAQEKTISGQFEEPGERRPRRVRPAPNLHASSESVSRKSGVATISGTLTDDRAELGEPKRRKPVPAGHADPETTPRSRIATAEAASVAPAKPTTTRERGPVATPASVIGPRAMNEVAAPREPPVVSIGSIDIVVAPPQLPALPRSDPRTRGFSSYSRLRRGLQR